MFDEAPSTISSKGKLIWPADGFISEKFAVHSHDLYNSLENV